MSDKDKRVANKERDGNGTPEPRPPRPSFFKRLRRVFKRRKRPKRTEKRDDYVNVDPADIVTNHISKSGKRLSISGPRAVEPKPPPNTLQAIESAPLTIEAPPLAYVCSPVEPNQVEQVQTESVEAACEKPFTLESALPDPDLKEGEVIVRHSGKTGDTGNLSDDSDEDVCATYVPMGKPLRGLRKSKTFSEGVLTKPRICTLQYTSYTPTASRPFMDTSKQEEERRSITYQTSAIEVVEDETEEDDNTHLELFKAFNESSRQDVTKSVYMNFDTNLKVGQRRGFPPNSTDLKFERSSDDLFKSGWWKSAQSLHDAHEELETKHDAAAKVVPDCDLYVRMAGQSSGPPGCRPPPGNSRRSRSLTMPNVFASELEDTVSDDLPKLTLWCPQSQSGERNSGSTIKFNTCPRPCSVAQYVNFKGSIPPK
ncbi:uncharacterized protein LOC124112766 [Haliotis rufescens]|uniref:uncharacterized protein LOC124112766 n=1 Tax=Haliotis rufescens TaxID=6454 RepID=UPI00201F74B6|nr:uncharacterized protein LOC124112766 [Haliotis rufescens]